MATKHKYTEKLNKIYCMHEDKSTKSILTFFLSLLLCIFSFVSTCTIKSKLNNNISSKIRSKMDDEFEMLITNYIYHHYISGVFVKRQ